MNATSLVLCWLLAGQISPSARDSKAFDRGDNDSKSSSTFSSGDPYNARGNDRWNSSSRDRDPSPSLSGQRSSSPAATIDDDPRSSVRVLTPPNKDTSSATTSSTSKSGIGDRAIFQTRPDSVSGAKKKDITPGDLLNQAIPPMMEGNAALTGKKLSLTDALARVTDRQQRLKATKAYWRLSATMAEHFYSSEEHQRLSQITTSGALADALTIKTARTNERARIRETEAAVLDAQAELADLLSLPSTDALPLASDLPLTGNYNTRFDVLFASKRAPAKVRIINRMLALRRETIEERADAVTHAIDAYEASSLAYESKAMDLQSVIVAHFDLGRQRRAFLAAVREYNDDIAEYALAVADPAVNNATLVSMLIKTNASTATKEKTLQPSLPNTRAETTSGGGVIQASATEPAATRSMSNTSGATAPNISRDVSDLPSVMRRGESEPASSAASSRAAPHLLPRDDSATPIDASKSDARFRAAPSGNPFR